MKQRENSDSTLGFACKVIGISINQCNAMHCHTQAHTVTQCRSNRIHDTTDIPHFILHYLHTPKCEPYNFLLFSHYDYYSCCSLNSLTLNEVYNVYCILWWYTVRLCYTWLTNMMRGISNSTLPRKQFPTAYHCIHLTYIQQCHVLLVDHVLFVGIASIFYMHTSGMPSSLHCISDGPLMIVVLVLILILVLVVAVYTKSYNTFHAQIWHLRSSVITQSHTLFEWHVKLICEFVSSYTLTLHIIACVINNN